MRGLAELEAKRGGEFVQTHGAFPNMKTRVAIREACEECILTLSYGNRTEGEADAFAFGFIRGILHQMKADDNPATADFARALLAQVNTGGIAAVKKILYSVSGR